MGWDVMGCNVMCVVCACLCLNLIEYFFNSVVTSPYTLNYLKFQKI